MVELKHPARRPIKGNGGVLCPLAVGLAKAMIGERGAIFGVGQSESKSQGVMEATCEGACSKDG